MKRMEASLDARHGTSDEFYDPYCDSCYEDGGQNVRAFGFCTNCVQFLCRDCCSVHGRLQATRHHDVVHGKDMPKSQADKPPRFDSCEVHPKLLKDQFCFDHEILLCSVCCSSEHNGCSVKKVEDVCTIVDVSDTAALHDRIRSLQETLKLILPTVDKAMMDLKDQEQTMLHDAQKVYDQIIAQANKLYGTTKNEIQKSCQSQISDLSQQRKKISDLSLRLDAPLTVLGELKTKPLDTKLFLRLQEKVTYTKKVANKLQELRKSLRLVSLSFISSQSSQEILSSSFTIGNIRKSESNLPGVDISVPEIMFSVSALKQATAPGNVGQIPGAQDLEAAARPRLLRPTQPLLKMSATKQNIYNIIQGKDTNACWITGVAITKHGKILLTDFYNRNVKLFSHSMKSLSSATLPDGPWDIPVISDKKAVVTTDNSSLVVLNISGSQLSIKTTTDLPYVVQGISRYKNKLVVTSPGSKPPCVKLIDLAGRVYWSVSSDQQGQPLFRNPCYVSSHVDRRSSTVIVADEGNDTLTLLNGDTEKVITRRQQKERKNPEGVTTDTAGNVYVCYCGTSEVAVLSGDLSEEEIILSSQDGLNHNPYAIVIDDVSHKLIISYYGGNEVHQYELS